MKGQIRILVMRHASFYAPLIGTLAAGFLEAEGLEGTYQVRPADRNPFEMLRGGEVDVMQSAVSSSWARIERGAGYLPRHFARINRRDGFWLVSRTTEPFAWKSLEGSVVLTDHGPQPLAMLRYAADQQGVELNRVTWQDVGGPSEIETAWRAGAGDFAHFQGPRPEQIARDGAGVIAASVGAAMPPVAFSTVAAEAAFLETSRAKAFMRAYMRSLRWVVDAPPGEIALRLQPFFSTVDQGTLTASIRAYQTLGCWAPDPVIARPEYAQALDVFVWNGLIADRYDYESVVSNPWRPDRGS